MTKRPRPPPPAEEWVGPSGAPDPPRPVLALSPCGRWVGVALGGVVACLDRSTSASTPLPHPHAGPVRALAFSPSGSHLASGGDDKAVLVREVTGGGDGGPSTWPLVSAFSAPKKVSSLAFYPSALKDGKTFVLAGDKFGDVLAGCVPPPGAPALATPLPSPLPPGHAALGHFCTILTGLAALPPPPSTPATDGAAGGWLASADGGARVRVSALPSDPTAHAAGYGIPESLAFCAGHTAFVTGVVWCGPGVGGGGGGGEPPPNPPPSASHPLSPLPAARPPSNVALATSSGDGSVRTWAPSDGRALATHWLTPQASAHDAARAKDRAAIAARLAARRAAAARAFAAHSGGGGGAGKEGGGGGEGEEDEPVDDCARPDAVRRPPPPAVVTLAASPDGRTLAAVVEGVEEVRLLAVGEGGEVRPAEPPGVVLPGVARPTAVAWDSGGAALWGVGVSEADGLAVAAVRVGGGAGDPALAAGAAARLAQAVVDPTPPDAAAAKPTADQFNLELRRTAAMAEPRLDPAALAGTGE